VSHSLREEHSLQRFDPVGTAAVQLLHLKPEIKTMKLTLRLLCKTDEKETHVYAKQMKMKLTLSETTKKVTFVNVSTASAGDSINDGRKVAHAIVSIHEIVYKEEAIIRNTIR
jgi:hypothetical protein